jgi:hypothetical protein
MRGRATPLKMKGLAVAFTLSVMGRRATPLLMKDFPIFHANASLSRQIGRLIHDRNPLHRQDPRCPGSASRSSG